MASLRNKKKLAAVSRETPKNTRNIQSRNAIDLEMAQGYFTQISEGIDGRVTKKLSKEFSRTESRILGALSKLDEFLLNPQVRTCSLAVLGTSGNSNSENREPTGDRSVDDPCPEVRFSSHHSGHLNSPEAEDYPHSNYRSWAVKPRRKKPKIIKNAFSSKLLDLCKTRTRKSSPDMFNFYVVLVRHDKVSIAGRATTCWRKFKASSLETRSTKNEGPPENMCFKGRTVWRFQTKKTETLFSTFQKKPVEHKDPERVNWTRPS